MLFFVHMCFTGFEESVYVCMYISDVYAVSQLLICVCRRLKVHVLVEIVGKLMKLNIIIELLPNALSSEL